jgi:hypothetical protein
MIDLERSLAELADRVQIPGGDWLVGDVVRRVGEPVERLPRRRAITLAGALVALLAIVTFALPGPRHAVARWLGFDSVHIEPGVNVPTTVAPTTIAPTTIVPTTIASTSPSSQTTVSDTAAITTTAAPPALGLGPSVSMAEAMSLAGLPDPTPALLGRPESVHVVQPPDSGQIILVYGPSDLVPLSSVTGVGALVSVLPAHIEEGFFAKALGNDATVRPVDVVGADGGYWIEGAPHQLFFESGGHIELDTLRLATNTLLWQRGDHIYRLEADISLETALRIAASVP